jgi:trimethylamine--corrinoid protein Co-methyltransferase
MVIDNDIIGMALRATRGIEVSDETLSLDVIMESTLNPGHFLGHSQTLAFMEKEYLFPTMSDRSSLDGWAEGGSKNIYERSQTKVKEVLSSHYVNYIDPVVDAAIRQQYPIELSSLEMSADAKRW